MSMGKIQNSVIGASLRTIQKVKDEARWTSTSTLSGKKNVRDMNAAALNSIANFRSDEAAANGRYSAIGNTIDYISSAQDFIQEIEDTLNEGLMLAASASDATMQGSIGNLNSLYGDILARLQNIVDTTHDSSGNRMLSGVISNFNPAAAGNIALIVATPAIMRAADAAAANLALKGLVGLNLDAVTTNKLDQAASQALIQYGANAAGAVNYIANALSIIQTIGVDSSQIDAQLNDATRAAQIGSKLQAAVTNAIAAANTASGLAAPGNLVPAQRNIKTAVVAALINEAIPAGAFVTLAPAPVPGSAQAINAASIRALLTTAEIQSLKNIVAVGGSQDAASAATAAADGGATPAAILMTELSAILGNISCFQNIPTLCPAVTTPASDLFGAVTIAAAGITTAGNVVAANIFGDGAKTTISTYVTTAATNRITNSKPQTVQIGRSPNDTLSPKILDMSPDALGLKNTSLTSIADAQTTASKLQYALGYIANSRVRLNNQEGQLEGRRDSTADNVDDLTEKLEELINVNPVENAMKMAELNHIITSATGAVAMESAIKDIIERAARNLIATAAAA